MPVLTLGVKPTGISGASEFSISVGVDATVGEVKEQVGKMLGLSGDGVRLVCAGKILAINEALMTSFGVKDGSTLFCIKEIKKAAPPAASQILQRADPMKDLIPDEPPPPGDAGRHARAHGRPLRLQIRHPRADSHAGSG